MTIEYFCSKTWNLSYSKVLGMLSKKEYKEFMIPKKNGSRRINYVPEKSDLYSLQKNLNKFYLDKQVMPVCTKGFKKGENYLSYLESHIGNKYFLRLDILDFFPSIKKEAIEDALVDYVISENSEEKGKIIKLISDVVTYNDVLPQGAATSPTISNIVMAKLDQRILKYCQVFGIVYTRYADDMLFSSEFFNFEEKKWFIKKIKHILSTYALKLNYNKIKYGYTEISLNGYVVSQMGIRLSRNRLSDIRHIVSFAQNNFELYRRDKTVFLHMINSMKLKHRNLMLEPFDSIFQFLQYLCGYRAFLLSFLNCELEHSFSHELLKLINKIEKIIIKYNKY